MSPLNIYFVNKVENNVINEKEEILNISQFSPNQIKQQFEDFCQENSIQDNIKQKILNILIKKYFFHMCNYTIFDTKNNISIKSCNIKCITTFLNNKI